MQTETKNTATYASSKTTGNKSAKEGSERTNLTMMHKERHTGQKFMLWGITMTAKESDQ
jgi:hypothetical protein